MDLANVVGKKNRGESGLLWNVLIQQAAPATPIGSSLHLLLINPSLLFFHQLVPEILSLYPKQQMTS
jgi:hypothetical protein